MANIITELHLEMSDNWYVTKKLNSVGRVGENNIWTDTGDIISGKYFKSLT